ncbi:MAG: PQQ-binding-like beta-propeller repeat protein [Verrucomicrobiae bacterium]
MKYFSFLLVMILASCLPVHGGDWPTYGGNAAATFSTAEDVRLPLLPKWVLQSRQPPAPAIKNGHAEPRLIEPITYDYVFHPVIAGGLLYYGSSSEDAVICLDTATGAEKWIFYANGPVRIPPTVDNGHLFFGSDDGFVYCLDAATGAQKWKYRAAPEDLKSSVLGRPASAWPVNSGPLLHEGTIYCAAGFLPPQGVWLHAIDAASGRKKWSRQINYAPRGQMSLHGEWLWVPTGRTAPAEFKLADGTPRVPDPALRRAFGGSYVGSPGPDLIAWGPNEWGLMNIRFSEESPSVAKNYATGVASGTMTMVEAATVVGDATNLYFVRKTEIWAIPRAKWIELANESVGGGKEVKRTRKGTPGQFNPFGISAAGMDLFEDEMLRDAITGQAEHGAGTSALLWSAPNDFHGLSALVAGKTLFVGGAGKVAGYDTSTGKLSWEQKMDGEVRGLAVAGGQLYVSTDLGKIICFSQQGGNRAVNPVISNPFKEDPAVSAYAEAAVKAANVTKGFCFVLGIGDGSLLAALARHSEFLVIGLEKDPAKSLAARQNLRAAGLYGKRVLVRDEPDAALDYALGLGNLVVSADSLATGTIPFTTPSSLALVQPYGGALVLANLKADLPLTAVRGGGFSKWEPLGAYKLARRGVLPGAGEWSHVYANPGATSSSGDELVSTDLALQWIGPPGPKDSPNRHGMAQPPLWKNGTFFYATVDQSLIAIDAYNGTNRWRLTNPLSIRQMMSYNAGGTCLGEDKLFLAAGDACLEVNTATGLTSHRYTLPDTGKAWGYAAVIGDTLLGSTQSLEAARAATEPKEAPLISFFVSAADYRSNPTFSDHLFMINHKTKSPMWDHKGPLVMQTTLAASNDTWFFAETNNPNAAIAAKGVLDLKEFFSDASLVALDLATGREKWRKKLEPLTDQNMMMYLGTSAGVLVSYRSYYENDVLTFEVKGINAATGADLWVQHVQNTAPGAVKPLISGKNAFNAHPVIMSGKVYVLPFFLKATLLAYDLKTGTPDTETSFSPNWQNKGCTPPTGASHMLFYRNTSVAMFDVQTRKDFDVTRVTRPACWLSVIPAGGLIITPEMGAYCTCGNAYQISLGLAPKEFPLR